MRQHTATHHQHTDKQIKKFGGLSSFGVEIKDLPKYLDATDSERRKLDDMSKGIPLDSISGQLRDWINISATELNVIYMTNKDLAASTGAKFTAEKPRYAIKADAEVKYIYVKDVFKTFTDMHIYTFNLITSMEGGSTVSVPAAKH